MNYLYSGKFIKITKAPYLHIHYDFTYEYLTMNCSNKYDRGIRSTVLSSYKTPHTKSLLSNLAYNTIVYFSPMIASSAL